jgi:hypothetical protein
MATDAFLTVVSEAQLGNKGLVITVYDQAGIKGHLMVGKASLIWFEKHAKKRGRKVSWDDFHSWILKEPEIQATRP